MTIHAHDNCLAVKSNTPILTDTASNYNSPNLYSKRTLESELSELTSAKRICTLIGTYRKTHITRNLINEFILEESNPTVPVLSNTNQIPCKCGKFDHKRTNFRKCILNFFYSKFLIENYIVLWA